MTVVPVPLPLVVPPPGFMVRVQLPVAGSPVSTTLPVATLQVGWVVIPICGAVGVTGWVLITAVPDELEVHPTELVTVQV